MEYRGSKFRRTGAFLWNHRVVASLLLVVCVFGAELLLLQLPQAQAAYTISNSARFERANSAHLTRTPSSNGSSQKMTSSAWFKLSDVGASNYNVIFGPTVYSSGSAFHIFAIYSDKIDISNYDGSFRIQLVSNAVLRDPAKWYHIVVAVDTTQAVAADRVKVYLDGVQVTSWSTATYPSQNYNLAYINSTSYAHGLQALPGTTKANSYLSDVYFIDGSALSPTCFGETDANGYWRPKTYSTASPCAAYGTNGFKLDFANGSDFGNDVSGNNNDWTNNNLVAADQVTDTPTNSFATLNAVSSKKGSSVLSNGNLRVTDGTNEDAYVTGTIGVPGDTSTGYYYEALINTAGTQEIGWLGSSAYPTGYVGNNSEAWDVLIASGNKVNNGSSVAYCASFSATDVMMLAIKAGKAWWGKNGTWCGSGDPAAGTNAAYTTLSAGVTYVPVWVNYGAGSPDATFNFGQGGQASLTYDSASGGTFKYTPPSGFKALSTNNLTAPTIAVPKQYFDAVPYVGTGAAQSVGTGAQVRVYLTSGTTWTVPGDWNSASSTIEVIGGGGNGGSGGAQSGGTGGGGGGYSKASNVSLTPGVAVTYAVGAAAGDTYLCNSTSNCASISGTAVVVGAKGGGTGTSNGSGGGAGGSSSSGVGSVKYSGGSGANPGADANSNSGGGGGGAAGPSGEGNTTTTNPGASGDAGLGGAGGATGFPPSPGGAGTEWDATHGSGGGGGGANNGGSPDGIGAVGGLYGGGGGGGYANRAGGAGAAGIIVITYTPIESVSFQPDLVWIKDRTSALMHNIFDSVRSVIPYLSSDSTAAEVGGAGQTLTAFASNGFTIGSNSLFNTSGNNYVSWMWKESPTSGMDVVTYTGTGAAHTISHSLGAAPDWIIIKKRSAGTTNNWVIGNSASGWTGQLYFDTGAFSTNSGSFNNTAPTASVFTVGTDNTVNQSGQTFVAYLFASTTGFSAFGTYTGNGSADGPFIYTGFKPKYLMVKRTDSASSGTWFVYDSAREPNNPLQNVMQLNANSAGADGAEYKDFLSNGFKLRHAGIDTNITNATYIYAAFAEIPFKYSSAVSDVGALSIASSTRFISGNSDYLNRTFSAGNQKTFTFSAWVKRGDVGTGEFMLLNNRVDANNQAYFRFTSNQFSFSSDTSGGALEANVQTNAVYRDPSAWYHVVGAVDTTQAIATDRIKLWVNGVQVTSFSTATYPSQNSDLYFNNAVAHVIGRNNGAAGSYFDGYMSDAYFIDGQALTPSSFGEYDTSGYWRPKTYSGTYGTNGFHLPLMGTSTAASVGTDTSGNGNTWTVNNIATTDFVSDSPTNSFATLNPIVADDTALSYTEGNLKGTIGAADGTSVSTVGMSSGKWVCEVTIGNTGADYVGIVDGSADLTVAASGISTPSYFYSRSDGNKVVAGSSSAYGATYTTGDVIRAEVDVDAPQITFFKNNSSQGAISISSGKTWFCAVGSGGGSGNWTLNFGQGGQSGLTYDSASGGYFKHTPTSGFKALSTANLATPTITKPNNYFDAIAYTASSTSLLMHFDGSNGGTTFTDSSTFAHSFSVTSGSPTISTTQSEFGGSSFKASAGPDYISASANSAFAFGTNDFTVDFWMYINSYSGSYQTVLGTWSNSSNTGDWRFYFDPTAGDFNFQDYSAGTGGSKTVRIATGLATGGWHHVAAVRSGSTLYGFLDGTLADTQTADTANVGSTQGLKIGAGYILANTGLNGYVDELQVIKGYAKWTTSFTTPAAPYTAGGSSAIGGANFQPGLVWIKDRTSANSHGIFDSSRSVYPALSSNSTMAEGAAASTSLTAFLPNGFFLGASTTVNTSGDNFISWLWKRCPTALFTASCTAGNGMDIVTYTGTGVARTISHSLGTTPDMIIVKDRSAANDPAVYHSSDTASPATDYLLLDSTAATADDDTYWNDNPPGYTKLLLHADGADAGTTFTDSSLVGSTVTLGGNAQLDTAQSKFGGASILLDGTGDYFTVPDSGAFDFGTGDFTIDLQFRLNSLQLGYLFDFRVAEGAPMVYCYINTDGSVHCSLGSGESHVTSASAVTTGTWYHLALVRSGTATSLYLDGVLKASATDSSSYTSTGTMWFGARHTNQVFLDGWIDEVRVSSSARWTAAFTPPTVAHTVVTGTESTFSVGTNADVNTSGDTYVAYLFKGIEGFSKFGSYTGNGSTDGPFVYTGFKPRYLLIKCTCASEDWQAQDTARNPDNVVDDMIYIDTSNAEQLNNTAFYVDLLSNGFKLRTLHAGKNTLSNTYIYAAFAEQPFYYSAQSAASAASSFVQAIAFLIGMVF